MLTHHRSVSLSFISTDLPIFNTLETVATLYERENRKFHLVLKEIDLCSKGLTHNNFLPTDEKADKHKNLLWLEISPYRIIMTKQSKEGLNYRYFWEQGVYGINRYWLNESSLEENYQFRLRNFTRQLTVKGNSIPKSIRIDYELWSDRLNLGHYVLHLELN